MVFSNEVKMEHGEVPTGHLPVFESILVELRNGSPPDSPQIVTPKKLSMITELFFAIWTSHLVLLERFSIESDVTSMTVELLLIRQPSNVPAHCLEKTGFHPAGQAVIVAFRVMTCISTKGTVSQSSASS